MSDIIGIIQSVEDDKDFNQKDYKKVTLEDGKELKVKYGRGGALKAKWGLLKEGVAIKFTMTDFTKTDGVKIPFVSDIATVEGELKPPQSDKAVLPEHQKEIDRAQGARDSDVIAPQEIGMWFKEVGELYRLGLISKNTPEGLALMTIYFARMKKALGLGVVKNLAPKKVEPEPELEPDDVPF